MLQKASIDDMVTTSHKFNIVNGDYHIIKFQDGDTPTSVLNADNIWWRNNSGVNKGPLIRRNMHAMTEEYRRYVDTPKGERMDAKAPKISTSEMTKVTLQLSYN